MMIDPLPGASEDPDTPNGSATRASHVYALLRRDIVHNQLKAGEKLRVENLAERYRVGATPVREALNRLSAEGLVSQQDQRGFRVSPISKNDLLELTRTRCWVTEIVMREAIAHGGEAWEEGIFLAFRRLSRTPNLLPGDTPALNPAWEQQHHLFHDSLVAACPSRMLLDFYDRMFEAADRYRNLATGRRGVSGRDVQEEHRAIMEATIGRRTEDAIRLLNEHTERTTQTLLELLDEQREPELAKAALPSSAPSAP
jgi:GntR family transcriptional regulator, carbon starvation induced regulator